MDKSKIYLVGKPNIGSQESFSRRTVGLFESGWLTNNGPMVQELETQIAEYLGVKHCIAMSNGTVALELAIRANGLSGEVILPSMTFIATAHALQWQGITPVFADIDRDTLNICPQSTESLINEHTTGILGVHLYGRGCNVEGLQDVADRNGLKLLFDAAHAFGSAHEGQMIGNFGTCEAFSFHATKVFNSFEGGAVTTNDDDLAQKLRLMRNFGFEGEDNVSYIGTNGKMSEICAAMGLTNMESLQTFIEVNKANYQIYKRELGKIDGVTLVEYDEEQENNYHYIILCVDSALYGKTRDQLKQELESYNVMARRYFHPGCHRMEPYKTLNSSVGKSLPATEAFSQEVLAMPNGTQASVEDISNICRIVREFAQK